MMTKIKNRVSGQHTLALFIASHTGLRRFNDAMTKLQILIPENKLILLLFQVLKDHGFPLKRSRE